VQCIVKARTIHEAAPAKLNLFLHVGQALENGYHPLDSLVVFLKLGDQVSISPADTLTLNISGPFSADLASGSENLVLRATQALGEKLGIVPKLQIVLEKNLPVASGIGGGSADAAATLRALLRFWQAELSTEALNEIAAKLGSDVPSCIASTTVRMSGVGEILTKAPLLPPEIPIVLANSGAHLSTTSVFHQFDRISKSQNLTVHRFPDCGSMPALTHALASCRNDLEHAASSLCPRINDVLSTLNALPRARLVRMAGSGATCFALFNSRLEADAAARLLQDAHPNWWVRSTCAIQ
jgi:4-diphosphocytidyl-2-C-methyl-D-erythritol kinase